jgi:two-component system nitrogen regulation response regulator NtrX
MKPHILVVDDEPDIRSLVKDILEDEGYTVAVAENGETARQMVRRQQPGMILLDIWMPDVDGITLLKEFTAELGITAPVVMMSGHGTVETAVEATRLGARDYIEKPLSLAKLLHTVEDALATKEATTVQELPSQAETPPIAPIGKSIQMQHLREQLDRIAQHHSTVLILGEPGSGKTFCAKYLHANKGPFLDVHMRLLQDGQADALLLGYEDPSGRVTAGFFDLAQGGTLFLDDIAELDLGLQESLFAALSTGRWARIHGRESQQLNIRIIAASHYDLEREVQAGRLSRELYHFLSRAVITIPPLREHAEDITELLDYYTNILVDQEGMPYRSFSVAAQNRLRHHDWPGNIRELESLVRRLLVLGLDTKIELDEVEAALETSAAHPTVFKMPEFDLPLRQAREQFEKAYLEYHLQEADWSVGKVAKEIGMERTHLYRKLRSLGIDTRRLARDK